VALERFSAAWREAYVTGAFAGDHDKDERECVFCSLAQEEVSESTGVLVMRADAFIVLNAFPYGSGHLLVVPRRHVRVFEELSDDEYTEFSQLLRVATRALYAAYAPEGMNVGMNLGSAAGAGIPNHVHAHALPRWNGDTNFMTTIGETRVLPESLASTWQKVHAAL